MEKAWPCLLLIPRFLVHSVFAAYPRDGSMTENTSAMIRYPAVLLAANTAPNSDDGTLREMYVRAVCVSELFIYILSMDTQTLCLSAIYANTFALYDYPFNTK
ncbi:hypothetical protein Q7C36_001830 [Tachysurus vachellii]|uniref:Secreted protein n=1 Tax=Tachysurus vachellii TaxID=175792 RepID=A0AA88T8B9_TACVA|nr:hypothetical protein Q7C36_001830 [Tachysurus vachellii]